ncbi:MAG: TetR/AcrR family transcriptional regulator [Paenibacillaceae bacterium]
MQPPEQWVEELLKLNDQDEKMTDKQMKIIQAAVETFSKKGYAASSTSEIAQKAGVAEGTIFRYYRTKKDLLLSIVAPIMSKLIGPFMVRDFAKVIDAPYPTYEDFIRAILRNRLEFARKNLPVIKILMQEMPFHEDLKKQFKELAAKHILSRIIKVVEQYQQKGTVITIPPLSVIRFTISAIFGFVMTLLIFIPGELNESEEIELTIRMIMHGVAHSTSDPASQIE